MGKSVLIENLPICFQTLDNTACITEVNGVWLELFGYSEKDVIGKEFANFLTESSKVLFKNAFQNPESRSVCRMSVEVLDAKGNPIFVEINGKHIYDKQGERSSTHCLLVNISERKNIERLSLESEERFRRLFQQSPHGIGIVSPDGIISKTNDQLCKMLGYESGELESQLITDLSHKDELEESVLNFTNLLEQKTTSTSQTKRYRKKDGSYLWTTVTSSVLKDSTGKIQYIIGTVEDLTERMIAESTRKVVYNISNAVDTTETLEELIIIIKDQLATLIDTTNFYVAIYNPDEDCFTLPYYTDKYDHGEFISFPAEKTVSNYVLQTKMPLLATPQKLEELEQKNEIILVGPASKIWLGIPLIFKGKIYGVMAVQSYEDEHAFSAVDLEFLEHVSQQISISIARKKSEEELTKALKMARESDRIKSTFLSTMSHELRTPLNAVIGFSEILVDELKEQETVRFAEIINSSGNHLLELVEGLFDITLIESGMIKLRKENHQLHNLLNNVNELMHSEQKKMGITDVQLQLHCDLAEDFTAHTDALKLKQILLNLLKNALKFTKHGRIDFGCSLEVIDEKEQLLFYVKDTGIGIPHNKLDYIFESFNQIDDKHSRQHDGAGIGLSVAKQLAELLGGKIWVESEIGKGSKFNFTIQHTQV